MKKKKKEFEERERERDRKTETEKGRIVEGTRSTKEKLNANCSIVCGSSSDSSQMRDNQDCRKDNPKTTKEHQTHCCFCSLRIKPHFWIQDVRSMTNCDDKRTSRIFSELTGVQYYRTFGWVSGFPKEKVVAWFCRTLRGINLLRCPWYGNTQ